MVKLGYALSSEEHNATDLVKLAQRAEETGFDFAFVSDHYHPWLSIQGESPFVWSVLGGISQVTKNIIIGTGVTCPTMRTHPAIIAHASATAAQMLDGRFILGLGTGENLNEHIVGEGWPIISVRQEMLSEAIQIIKQLWSGENITYFGDYYVVEDARLYTLPHTPPKIAVAAWGETSAEIAVEHADAFISTAPDKDLLSILNKKRGKDLPKYGQATVCYDENKDEAIRIAHKYWANTALKGQLNTELRTVNYFEDAVKMVTEEDIKKEIVCGPAKQDHIQAIKKYIDAGYTHVYVHQIGPHQEKFFNYYKTEIFPEFK